MTLKGDSMHLGRKLTIMLLFVLVGYFARAQTAENPGTITGTQCLSIDSSNTGTIGIDVENSGSAWSGTIQPQVAIGGGPAANAQVTPSTSSTAQSTITANGIYYANTSGSTLFQVCGATVTNKASIRLFPSTHASGGRGGGGGSGTITAVVAGTGLSGGGSSGSVT